MSFSKKIENLQKRPLKERKLVALFSTGIIFLVVMVMLSYGGAFTLPSFTLTPAGEEDLFSNIKEEASVFVGEVGEQIDRIATTTDVLMEEIRKVSSSTIASTTASTTKGDSVETVGVATSAVTELPLPKNVEEEGVIDEEKSQEIID